MGKVKVAQLDYLFTFYLTLPRPNWVALKSAHTTLFGSRIGACHIFRSGSKKSSWDCPRVAGHAGRGPYPIRGARSLKSSLGVL